MEFTKMHGCGNDYIYFDCTRQPMDRDLASQLAVRLSDRHFGIGGDGIILIEKGQNADFEMVMYNADGSRGAMCGNGIRCVAKYVYDHKLTDKTTVTIASMGAVKTIDIQVQDTDPLAVAAYAESLMPGWGGVGRYPVKAGRAKGWVHVDTRPNKSRWTL